MTEQELHEKIINIIKENGVYNGKSMHRDYYVVNDEELADALIAAEIGDVKDLKAQVGTLEMTNIFLQAGYDDTEGDRLYWVNKYKEAEHRADVAERALKDCVEYYSYSGLCPVLDCNYNKACWRKECTSDIAECFKIQAEKELAEEESKDAE